MPQHLQTLRILGPYTALLAYIATTLPIVMPSPPIHITEMYLTSWVTALVNQAVDDVAELLQVNKTSTGAGGIQRVMAVNKHSTNQSLDFEYDGLFVDPVAIADLTVAGTMLDLTPILQGDVDWWVGLALGRMDCCPYDVHKYRYVCCVIPAYIYIYSTNAQPKPT